MDTIQSLFELKALKLTDQIETSTNILGKVGKIDGGLLAELESVPKKVLIRTLNTAVGIEVETEGLEPVDDEGYPQKHWGAVADGSLRNGGMEFITHMGIRAHDSWDALLSLFAYLRKHKAKTSDRTSIHVHLNALNMTCEEVNSLLILYAVTEDSLFDYAGKFRSSNVFCTPMHLSHKRIEKSLVDFIGGSQKYAALNTLALKQKGTVEFRHMHTSYDTSFVFRWVMMLCLLRYYARYNSLEKVKEQVSNLKTKSEYNTFFQQIFYGFSKYLLVDPEKVDCLATDAKLLFFGED